MNSLKHFMVVKELITLQTGSQAGAMPEGGLPNVFTYTNLVHAVAGAVGSVVSMVVFYPLDTARTRLQVEDKREAKHSPSLIAEIIKQEGLGSLYRGLVPVVTTLCCSNFVYFYVYNSLKAVCLTDQKDDGAFKDLAFAFVAGVVNVLATTPLWVANMRMKLQGLHLQSDTYKDSRRVRYKNIIDCVLRIGREEGVGTLWNGTRPSLILATNPALHFMMYETIKRYFQASLQQTELSGFLYFIIGALAKTVATVLTYPLQIIQSRMRAGSGKDKSTSMLKSFLDILRLNGVFGLYKGMEAKLLQTVLTAALMFMVYEKIAAATFRLMGLKYTSIR